MESLYENMKCALPKIGYPRNLTSVKFEKFELQPEKSSENFNTRHPNLNKLDRENPTWRKEKKKIHNNLNTQQWSGVFDKRRTFNRLEDAWAVVWGGEGGSKREGGGWNGAPISEGERDSEKWCRLEGAGRGHLGAFTPCEQPAHSIHSPLSACAGAYVYPRHVYPRPAVCRALPRLYLQGGLCRFYRRPLFDRSCK